MEKILITGGAGLIGSNLVKNLIDKYDIFVVDNLWRGKKENLYNQNNFLIPKSNFFELDLSDYDNCLKVTKEINTVFHLKNAL